MCRVVHPKNSTGPGPLFEVIDMKILVLSALVLASPAAFTAAPAAAQDWSAYGCRDANCSRDVQQARQAQTDPGYRPGNYGNYGYNGYNNGVGYNGGPIVYYENSTSTGRTKRSGDPVNGKQFCRYRDWSSWIPINQVCPGAPAPQAVAAPTASTDAPGEMAPIPHDGIFHLRGSYFIRESIGPDGTILTERKLAR
ncbi:MAG: hypothetical protein JWL75_755 [Parcubacteria group bacterium]|nr:hypothetical protein [Parcubacteria group bacterium]